ncbi:hypothetical protein E2C01_089189 [Portunus trituberculatus]|uniref:CSD domain-containing protein n=1 Tax=Portunus trituberculatus TaxID=210409 RepID=A0A5B7JLS6_PORTR|nr:hypothetical protein [Portunus trituberculatus]
MDASKFSAKFTNYFLQCGYGFVTLPKQGKDVFVHSTGLTRSLKETPPREEDHVLLNLRQGDKGPEARDVACSEPPSRQPTKKPPSSRKTGKKENITGKIYACVYTAKAIARTDLCRLQKIIPILLQHNGLPVISKPLTALSAPPRSKMRPTRPPSGKQDEDDGWVTKQKRRRRPRDDSWVLPKEERTTTPSAALSQSPTIARLRLENQIASLGSSRATPKPATRGTPAQKTTTNQ